MSEDVKQRAYEVIGNVRAFPDTGTDSVVARTVDALSAAGLLRTGLERRAVEACKEHYGWHIVTSNRCGACDVGLEALSEERAAPERRTVIVHGNLIMDKPGGFARDCIVRGHISVTAPNVTLDNVRTEERAAKPSRRFVETEFTAEFTADQAALLVKALNEVAAKEGL